MNDNFLYLLIAIAIVMALYGLSGEPAIRRLIDRLRRRPPAAPPIEEPSTEEWLQDLRRQSVRDAQEIARDQYRVTQGVAMYARDTLRNRSRAPLPIKLPRSVPIAAWLPGLTHSEIDEIANASLHDLSRHLFYGDKLPRVRAVGPLEEVKIVFPHRVPPPDEHVRYAGGSGIPKPGGGGFGGMRR